MPRTRFLVAGDAWKACRTGADATTFGVAGTPMWGLIEVLGNVMQDLAALQKIELLPWGWYGVATEDGVEVRDVALFDSLAELSHLADAGAIVTLQSLVDSNDRLRVPEETLAAIVAAEGASVAGVSAVTPAPGAP